MSRPERRRVLVGVLLAACHRASPEDTGPHNQVPGDLIAMTETAPGRLRLVLPGTDDTQGEVCLHEILPDVCAADPEEGRECLLFSAEHQRLSETESAFLLTYSRRDPDVGYSPAGAVLATASHPPQVVWAIDQLYFPEDGLGGVATLCADGEAATDARCHLNGTHVVAEQDDGTTLWAADTNNSRALLLARPTDGSTTATVLGMLDEHTAGWGDARSLNHLQLLTVEGRPMLLTTFKSAAPAGNGSLTDTGRLVLWDISTPTAPEQVWVWPDPETEGFLAAVHHGIVQETAQGTLLVYAHSLGASDDPDAGLYGSVGLARFNGTAPPTYLADALLPDSEFPLGFVREAEVPAPGDWLLITDSGCENAVADCSYVGRVLAARLPDLSPEGQSGALGDQRFVTLELLEDVRRPQLTFPYEADALYADEVSPALLDGIGDCATAR